MQKTSGIVLMFVGAVIMSIFLFVDMDISFKLWAAGFIWGMVVSAAGAVLGIIYFVKKIKAEQSERTSK